MLQELTEADVRAGLVSIAGAILWGVLHQLYCTCFAHGFCFNRRGDSLGGAALKCLAFFFIWYQFQSQGRFFGGCCAAPIDFAHSEARVSIAGAILWGVLPTGSRWSVYQYLPFQSQGRFFGGCCINFTAHVLHMVSVSIAGAILWGVLRI